MSPVFFTDRDLGKRFPAILAAAGRTVERHDERFAPDVTDEEWLEYVGRNDRVAITHDQRIRYKPNEREAVLRHRVRLLVVVGKAPLPDLAHGFVRTLSRIEAFLESHEAPFIAKVYRSSIEDRERGRVTLWFPAS